MRTGPRARRPLAARPRKGRAGAPSTVRAVRAPVSRFHIRITYYSVQAVTTRGHCTRRCHRQHCLSRSPTNLIRRILKLKLEAWRGVGGHDHDRQSAVGGQGYT